MASLEVTFHGLDPSDALAEHAQKHLDRLIHLDPRITRCRVAIERPNHRHRHGERTRIGVEVWRPGGELVINHEGDELDAYAALGHAFDSMRRQLVEALEQRRGHERAHRVANGSIRKG
jgi:ribosome-associated translation inhibitor RaiA